MNIIGTIIALATISITTPSIAGCVGYGGSYSCTDQSGNSYSVNRYGGSTYMNGRNAGTGSTWSQSSNSYGGSTYTTGRDSSGRSWNMNQTPYGTSGHDANGRSFYYNKK